MLGLSLVPLVDVLCFVDETELHYEVHVLYREIGTSVERLEEDFETEWRAESGGYLRKFVEFCSSRALSGMCQSVGGSLTDGSFSRLTFDMMLAWEMPGSAEEEAALVISIIH